LTIAEMQGYKDKNPAADRTKVFNISAAADGQWTSDGMRRQFNIQNGIHM